MSKLSSQSTNLQSIFLEVLFVMPLIPPHPVACGPCPNYTFAINPRLIKPSKHTFCDEDIKTCTHLTKVKWLP